MKTAQGISLDNAKNKVPTASMASVTEPSITTAKRRLTPIIQYPMYGPSSAAHDANKKIPSKNLPCSFEGDSTKCTFIKSVILNENARKEIDDHLTEMHFSHSKKKNLARVMCPWPEACELEMSKGELARHINTVHLKGAPAICPRCQTTLSRGDNLKRHFKLCQFVPKNKFESVMRLQSITTAERRLTPDHQHAMDRSSSTAHDVNVDIPSNILPCSFEGDPTKCTFIKSISLNDKTRGKISGHLREIHFPDLKSDAVVKCPWPGPCQVELLKAGLVKHVYNVHLQASRVACPHCQGSISRKDALKGHIQRMHPALINEAVPDEDNVGEGDYSDVESESDEDMEIDNPKLNGTKTEKSTILPRLDWMKTEKSIIPPRLNRIRQRSRQSQAESDVERGVSKSRRGSFWNVVLPETNMTF